VRPGPPDAAGTAGTRPGPPDAAGTAGMRPGPLGPPGRGRASGRIWTHSHREPEQILHSQWGQAGGQRPPVSLNTRRGAAGRTIECELSQ
jgi:hypothetical protein